MGTILCYNLGEEIFEKTAAIASICGADTRAVGKAEYSKPILALLEGSDDDTPDGENFSEAMMVFCGLDDNCAGAFLDALRAANLSGGIIKAFLTDTNKDWSSAALYRELCSERAAFEKMRS